MSIVLIHLTDIHIDSNKNPIIDKCDKIIKAINSTIKSDDAVIFTVTGDISFSGQPIEYDAAKTFFNRLKNGISTNLHNPPMFIMVPGNHDCYFDKNNSIRDTLINTYQFTYSGSNDIPNDALEEILKPQNNCKHFFESYDLTNDIIGTKEVCINNKKLLFILINSAWLSQYHEKCGTIYIPSSLFPTIYNDQYDCIITLMHHPTNWFHPDNALEINEFIRKHTDLLLLGHEHTRSASNISSDDWSITEKRGKELQNSYNENDSAFSVYKLDYTFSTLTTINFYWYSEIGKYRTKSNQSDAFSRNLYTANMQLSPNNEFIKQLNNLEIPIQHHLKNDIILSDIYCWPQLGIINDNDEKSDSVYDSKEQIINNLLSFNISIVVGDRLHGKTALAKMIYMSFLNSDKCCIICNGDMFTSCHHSSIEDVLKELFIAQYNSDLLDSYLQVKKDNKILIIDNFDKINLSKSNQYILLNELEIFFGNIIIFSNSYWEMMCQLSTIKKNVVDNVQLFKIKQMGNSKRKELITKWMSINNNENNEILFENNVENVVKKIDHLLGDNKFIMPSTPIYLLNLLQDLNSIEPSFKGSQYGFLYGTLVQKSLSNIKYKDAGENNIDIAIMSMTAFEMLTNKRNIITCDEINSIVSNFSKKHKVNVSCDKFLNNMLKSNILVDVGLNNYKFKYPYLFYYFTGRYIAYNSSDSNVKQQVDYMSQRLYNYEYGDILIFACHFSNNKDIIESVLCSAYYILDKFEPFDFNERVELFANANKLIEKMLVNVNVGDENSVIENRNNKLKQKDRLGILNGEIDEIDDNINDDIDEENKIFSEFSSALKTIEVLGQIIKNYPGDIEGDFKIEIINEVHLLGMRLVGSMLKVLNYCLEDLLDSLLDNIDIDKKKKDEISKQLTDAFAVLVGGLIRGTISTIGKCLNSEHLLFAIDEAFNQKNCTISQQLVRQEIKCNFLNKLSLNELEGLEQQFRKQKNDFALIILRSIVSQYLSYNNCGHSIRQKLCSLFHLSPTQTFINSQKKCLPSSTELF